MNALQQEENELTIGKICKCMPCGNSILPSIFAVALTVLSYCNCLAQDSDRDGIQDAIEQELLSAFAPVWRPDQDDDRFPPLPIRWYVEHCEMRQYYHAERDYDYNGDSNKGVLTNTVGSLTLESALALARIPLPPRNFLRLQFKSGAFHDGKDPSNPRTWSIAQQRQDCLYGRCTRLSGAPADVYLLQYYLFFGWNDVDADRNSAGCPLGNHEGDIVCAEFEVRYRASDDKEMLRAVLHNHGRQIFVDDPRAFDYSAGRPIVWLEKEVHELWPYRGSCGFEPATLRPCVGVNDYLESHDAAGDDVGGECDDIPTVRTHWGRGLDLLVTQVINLGERGSPGPSLEAQFVHDFRGLYGGRASDDCLVFFFWEAYHNTSSPQGPLHQAKMWDRAWVHPVTKQVDRNFRDVAYPGCSSGSWVSPIQEGLWVDFAWVGFEDGSFSNPFNGLQEAVTAVSVGGTINILPGSSAMQLMIAKPCTLTAQGGLVIIGE